MCRKNYPDLFNLFRLVLINYNLRPRFYAKSCNKLRANPSFHVAVDFDRINFRHLGKVRLHFQLKM